MPSFNINKKNDEHFFIEGDLTFFTLNKNTMKLFGFFKSGKKINIDLGGVNSADSAGLALIVELIKQSKLYGTQLVLKNIPQQLLTLANLSGLDIEKEIS
ncbi:MAG: STAS domain-containing protein [Methylomarinum sp.]|nr:STAS domain-containing protein [Methylomarinum sp.]